MFVYSVIYCDTCSLYGRECGTEGQLIMDFGYWEHQCFKQSSAGMGSLKDLGNDQVMEGKGYHGVVWLQSGLVMVNTRIMEGSGFTFGDRHRIIGEYTSRSMLSGSPVVGSGSWDVQDQDQSEFTSGGWPA